MYIFHHDKMDIGRLANVIDIDDIGVRQTRRRAGFAETSTNCSSSANCAQGATATSAEQMVLGTVDQGHSLIAHFSIIS